MVRAGAASEPTAEIEGDSSAAEGTIGADASGRGTLVTMPAVRLQEAIDLLDQGDVDGARRVLLDVLGR